MKKRMTLVLALMLCAATVFAAVSFSGTATVGYKFNFEGDSTIYGEDNDTADLTLAVNTDYAKLAFRNVLYTGDGLNSLDVKADISIYLDKVISDAFGFEMPVGITAYVGNTSKSLLYVYSDPTGAIGDDYGMSSSQQNRNNYPIAADITYGGIVTVRGLVDFTQDAKALGGSVLVTPIEGLSIAAGATNDSGVFGDKVVAPVGVNVSAAVDVDKLVDMPFSLNVSALTYLGFGEGFDAKNDMVFAAVTAAYDKLNGYVEYAYNDYANCSSGHSLSLGAGYKVLDNLTVGTTFAFKNLENVVAETLGYSVYAKCTFNELTFGAAFIDYMKKPGMKFYTSVAF